MSLKVRSAGAEAPDVFPTPYTGALVRPRVDASAEVGGPGAKQSFKDECDINRIMAKYQKTGLVTWLNDRAPQFADFTQIDFQECMNTVAQAKEMFAQLPSQVRKRFSNDPQELLAFMERDENYDEALKLGLVVKKELPAKAAPIEVKVVSETPPS